MITKFKLYENVSNKGLVLCEELPVYNIKDLDYDIKLLYTSIPEPGQGSDSYKLWLTPDYNFIVTVDNYIINLDSVIINRKNRYKELIKLGYDTYGDTKEYYIEILSILKEVKNELTNYIKKAKNGKLEIEMNAKKFNI